MNKRTLDIPEMSLVVLIGTSGAGKSTFAAEHFKPTEVISSDTCRGLVCDDETSMEATKDAFDVLHYIADKRLERGLVTVVDATNVQPRARRPLVALARKHHVLPVAIILDIPERICRERNEARDDRDFGGHVISNQRRDMKRALGKLRREGFRITHTLSTPEEVDAVEIERRPLWSDFRHEKGPFDIIGDVHGCCDELETLLEKLGYTSEEITEDMASRSKSESQYRELWRHPEGRKAVFVGDLVDRGPRSLDAFDLARNMVEHGTGLCVPGNHENKLLKKLHGRKVKLRHGLEKTVAELEALPEDVRETYEASMADFIRSMVSHVVLDDGELVVAHAGLKEAMHGRASGKVKSFAMYGETSGETDEFGLPIRYDWAVDYRGEANVVYGHTPVPKAEWLNRTINVDTGCVFGGKLTALRYPERELVSVPAREVYADPIRPIEDNARAGELSAQHAADHVLDVEDFTGKLRIDTELSNNVTIREGHSAAALETVSRFAVHPKWLIHLPPRMSPTHTTKREGYLEAPEEAFDYYRKRGVDKVVCEEKHMGSRAIVVVCRDEDVVRERFGLRDVGIGTVYTRTGRPFFRDDANEEGLLERVHTTLSEAGFWEAFDTDWVCLDTELMPWSVKAQSLLEQQYAPVAAAAHASLGTAADLVAKTAARGVDIGELGRRRQEALAGVSRIRAGSRVTRAVCEPRASAAGASVRVRGARPGE